MGEKAASVYRSLSLRCSKKYAGKALFHEDAFLFENRDMIIGGKRNEGDYRTADYCNGT